MSTSNYLAGNVQNQLSLTSTGDKIKKLKFFFFISILHLTSYNRTTLFYTIKMK